NGDQGFNRWLSNETLALICGSSMDPFDQQSRAGKRGGYAGPFHFARFFDPVDGKPVPDQFGGEGATLAAALVRTEMDSLPQELDDLSRRVMQLEIEEAALSKESDAASLARLEELRKELANEREEATTLRAAWEAEKAVVGGARKLREELERARHEMEAAERVYDLNKAAQLRHGTIPQLERSLREAEEASKGHHSRLFKEAVTDDEIAEIVSKWTGIPVSRLMEGERDKLLRLEEILHERVIGQEEGVRVVSEAILRSRAGIKEPKRPIGTFLFLGPTGVGKTELARSLAEALFDSEENMVRLDMSEYMEKHSVSRLIGAPPGYVGYEAGWQL
ncbi:MAG: AAA family ATPase, partial [Chthoniobacterales bacterium]